jgi:hypothetical protein
MRARLPQGLHHPLARNTVPHVQEELLSSLQTRPQNDQHRLQPKNATQHHADILAQLNI